MQQDSQLVEKKAAPFTANQLMQDVVRWDVRSWSRAIKFWDEKIDWNAVENCLELGGREGGLSLWLALKNKDVVCSDVGDFKRFAEKLHSKYGVGSRIRYQEIDATHIPYENHFDLIVFKSILGVVGSDNRKNLQEEAVAQMYKALKPGGKLLFAENLVASPAHRYLRSRYVKWGKRWRYIKLKEMKLFLKDFSSYELKTTGVISLLGRSEGQRSMLALLDQAVLNHVFPSSYKYILYGIAEK